MRAFALLLALALPVQSLAAAEAAPSAFTAEGFRANVDFLADDLLEGRNTGTRGYDLAARYVATRFGAMGLDRATGAKDWYQPVTLAEARLSPGATLSIGGTRFENGGDIVIGPSLTEAKQALSAGAVFVGFGLESKTQGFDDYAGLDVRGKFVVVLSGFPKGTPSDVGAHLNAEKAAIAQRHGAIGILTIYTRAGQAARPWAKVKDYAKSPVSSWLGDDGLPYVRTPGIRATASLNTPAAEALLAGGPRSLSQLLDQADRRGGRPKGFALAKTVAIERTSSVTRSLSENVIGVIPGSDPSLRNEYVLLMAHLDHNGTDPTLKGDQIYNGAMDNAAGVSTLLEVARAMATGPTRPRRSVIFAAVTAEEDGLLGSQYLARHPVIGDGKLVAVVNLDMPVLLYDFSDVVAFGAEHSTLGPIVADAIASANVTLSPDPLPEEGLFTRSDHYRFVQEGVPSVFLMTGFAGAGKAQFQDFLKNHYHKVSDQTDLPFDWAAGAKFAQINYLIARGIADADRAPQWYAGSFFGDTFAPAAPKATPGATPKATR